MQTEHGIHKLDKFLRGLDKGVILRNPDIRSNLSRGGDVDLLVPDCERTRRNFSAHLGNPSWQVRRSYVEQLFYPWGHLDIATTVEWRGAVYLPTERLLANAQRTGTGIPMPRLGHEAIVCWFSSLIWGGFFKVRYLDTIVSATRADGEEFLAGLQTAVGVKWGARLFQLACNGIPEKSAEWVGPLRRALWLRALARRPLQTMTGFLRFVWRELYLRINPPTPWIAVLGPDGSGKSTVLNCVRDRLGQAGIRTALHHWRPHVLRPGSGGTGPVTEPHGKPARPLPESVAKLVLLVLDWQIGYRFQLAGERAKGRVVLFDRHYLDLLVDTRRYRYGGPTWLTKLAAKFIPKPDLLFFLDAPTPLLQTRKKEVPAEETERQRKAYRQLVQSLPFGRILDATQRPEKVANDLVYEIFKSCNHGKKAR